MTHLIDVRPFTRSFSGGYSPELVPGFLTNLIGLTSRLDSALRALFKTLAT